MRLTLNIACILITRWQQSETFMTLYWMASVWMKINNPWKLLTPIGWVYRYEPELFFSMSEHLPPASFEIHILLWDGKKVNSWFTVCSGLLLLPQQSFPLQNAASLLSTTSWCFLLLENLMPSRVSTIFMCNNITSCIWRSSAYCTFHCGKQITDYMQIAALHIIRRYSKS